VVAGHEATPKDAQNVERLMRYWLCAEGEGAIKINWGVPGDFLASTVAGLSSEST
jgi:hypothetical protein